MSYVNVQIDLNDIHTDDMIEELESRGYAVIYPDEKTEVIETRNQLEDEIHNLYYEFITWRDFGMKDSNFESALKKFFEKTEVKDIV